jgi:hypothetical protein
MLALACLMTATAHAEWNVLTVNLDKTVTIWVESSSVKRRDDYVFAWVIYDREEAAEDGAMSSKALNQYDCANRQARTWLQSMHTKSMAGGERMPPRGKAQCEASDSLEIRLDDDCAQTWKPVLYRTTGADILAALCVGQSAAQTVLKPVSYAVLAGTSFHRPALSTETTALPVAIGSR